MAVDRVRNSLDVLRAHYGMIGNVPDPIPHPAPFPKAFLAAAETDDFEAFRHLPPLLLITAWDHSDFMPFPSDIKGRLRFLAAIADFCIDFNRTRMPWPDRTRLQLWKLERDLSDATMKADRFEGFDPTVGPSTGFFGRFGLTGKWDLFEFWRPCRRTLRFNGELLEELSMYDSAFHHATQRNLGEGDLEDPARLPFSQRVKTINEQIGRADPASADQEPPLPF